MAKGVDHVWVQWFCRFSLSQQSKKDWTRFWQLNLPEKPANMLLSGATKGPTKMKTFISLCAMAFALATSAEAEGFGGRYQVQGTNPNGSEYGGEAEITLTSNTTCEIKWTTGETESFGICMRNDDSFAAGYKLGDDIGLIIYKVQSDGSLHGLWTIAGKEGNGTEILTPIN
jgi:hypothetical protein